MVPIVEEAMLHSLRELLPIEYPDQTSILMYHFNWDQPGEIKQQKGKRLRPLLLLLAAGMVDGDAEAVLPSAVAVEFIHNFSLIHDDIEDHDETRHGRETVWKKYGIEKAINAGDALFSLAFTCLGELKTPQELAMESFSILSRTCARLTGGQNMDLDFEKAGRITLEDYLLMIEGKTASLFEASCRIGSVLGGGNKTEEERLAVFGKKLGLAFQIRDDWLGLWGDPGKTGKTRANDLIAGKKTFPILYASQRDPQIAGILQEGVDRNDAEKVIQLIDETGAGEYTFQYQDGLLQDAKNELSMIPQQKAILEIIFSLMDKLRE